MKAKYIEAVASQNVRKVRMMLADELLLDPRGITFKEMLIHAKSNLPNLFEDNKEADYEISPDRDTWNIELASTIKQDLISNFSIEKLALFQEVAMEVGKEKAKALMAEEKRMSSQDGHTSNSGRTSYGNRSSSIGNEDTSRKSTNKNKQKTVTDKRTMGTISLCGGAALSIIGVCVEGCIAKTLLCLVGGAAVVVGGIALLSENKKK